MKRTIIVFLTLSLIAIFTFLSAPAKTFKIELEHKNIENTPETPKEFLKKEVERQGLTERDFTILHEIIFCESSWSQFWERDIDENRKKGEVKVSSGNIGLMQINRLAHEVEYTRLNLDPFDEFDNIRFGLILYKRNGIKDWEQWSGHCFLPRLAALGITF